MEKAGVKALESKDYRTAIDLLKRAVDGDSSAANPNAANLGMASPGIKDGWYELGLAYAAANNHAEAIGAFRKQIELNPNHENANGELAMQLEQSGKTDEAIAAYRKQIEMAPYKKEAHKNLGLLLARQGKDADARIELEAAAAIPPPDPELKLALAQVYAKLGETAKAQELMKSLTGSAGGDSGSDIFAAALKSDIDPVQDRERRAAGAL